MFYRLRIALARIGRWPRVLAAGTCLLLAGASALDAHRPAASSSAAGVPVVIATRDLPAGHLLSRRDVALVRLPTRFAPPAALAKVADVVGHRLGGAVTSREPLTSARLIGPGLADGLDHDEVATPVELAATVTGFVRAGDRVDVLALPSGDDPTDQRSRTNSTETVARAVLVLAAFATSGADPPSSTIIVATSRELAARIARDHIGRLFTVILNSP